MWSSQLCLRPKQKYEVYHLPDVGWNRLKTLGFLQKMTVRTLPRTPGGSQGQNKNWPQIQLDRTYSEKVRVREPPQGRAAAPKNRAQEGQNRGSRAWANHGFSKGAPIDRFKDREAEVAATLKVTP